MQQDVDDLNGAVGKRNSFQTWRTFKKRGKISACLRTIEL
jgi:hypothetical protein